MYWKLFFLIYGAAAVEFNNPKLVNGRILLQQTDIGAMVSKARQCMNAQWNFTTPDFERFTLFNQTLRRFCERIPLIAEHRKEFEGPKSDRVYDFASETMKINCPFAPEMTPEQFQEEMENMFYLNKIYMNHGATPQHLLNAVGFTGGWDMEKLFVQKSMRVRPLYCDEMGVMMEICVPSIMDRFYGDVEEVIDIGTFNTEKREFSHINAPMRVISTRKEGKLVSINEEACMNPFDLGLVCPAEAMNACNVMTFEDCPLETIPITNNFTFIREFSTFHLVATTEKEMNLTLTTGVTKVLPVPTNIFLVAVGEGETMMIGDQKFGANKETRFSKTTFINLNDLAEPKQTETYQKKNFIQKVFSFFGKK